MAKRLAARGTESPLDPLDDVVDDATPLEVMSREELVGQVREAIQSLPPAYREAVVLCELQDMDYATAAAIMHCPIGIVRSRLHRAKAMLMTKLVARQGSSLATTWPTR